MAVCISHRTSFLSQISIHLDPAEGDCKEIKTLCPFKTVGCKETKVRQI